MALSFIMGNAGSGKSTYLYERILQEAKEHPEKNYLLIVPEQFTMQMQMEMVQLQENHTIVNVDVLSFHRLAHRVLGELGKNDLRVLEETGKNLILRKVAEEHLEELSVLKGNMRKKGYINELKSLISELTQYQVTPEKLEELLEEQGFTPATKYKIKDICTLYRSFQEYMEGTYITAEEILDILAYYAPQSKLLKDAVLAFDGFTGFTPIQSKLLQVLFGMAQNVYVTVTVDQKTDLYKKPEMTELFYMSQKMVQSLRQIATDNGMEIEEDIWISNPKQHRFCKAPALKHLEENIFRNESQVWEGDQDQIFIHGYKNPREELQDVAAQIHTLVREGTYRYGDIAIVSGSLSTYEHYADEIFYRYEIPYFSDNNRSINYHPFTEFMRGVFQTILENYSYESVFYLLRTGYFPFQRADIDKLENYVLAAGIRGRKWKQPFVKRKKLQEEVDIMTLEAMRKVLTETLSPLEQVVKKGNFRAKEAVIALYNIFVKLSMEAQLLEESRRFEAQGDAELAREYREIYVVVMKLLEKLVDLLGEEELPLKELLDILESGVEAANIGVIPQGRDKVILGDMERSRLSHVKVLFFLGVNDGIVPKAEDKGSILSELEREQLEDKEITLAPGGREKTFLQRFYLYLNVTKPEEKLIVSYHLCDAEGKVARPSYLLGLLQDLFPTLTTGFPEMRQAETPESGWNYLVRTFREIQTGKEDPFWYGLFAYFVEQGEELKDPQQLLKYGFYQYHNRALSPEVIHKLYGKVLSSSTTKLETYATCAYRYFLSQGLKLKERAGEEVQASDMGTVLHKALENYGRELKEKGLSWISEEDETLQALKKKAYEDAVLEEAVLALSADGEGKFLSNRLYDIFENSIGAIRKQLQQGDFYPDSFELQFGSDNSPNTSQITLKNGQEIRLKGVIDRVDLCEKEDRCYVKVVDYKSGSTTYDLLSIYYGQQLQLMIYLNAAMEMMKEKYPDKELKTGGVFYYHLQQPFVEVERNVEEEKLQRELLRAMRPDGMVQGEDEVVYAMDRDIAETNSSDVIPVKYKKDKTFDRNAKVLTEEEFRLVCHHVNRKVREFGEEIAEGNIAIAPTLLTDKDACTYCEFHGICKYDEKLEGFAHRELEKLGKEDIIERMKEEENHE